MRVFMIKKEILVLGAGLLVWHSISLLFYPIIVALIVEHNYPLYLNNLFYSIQSSLSGIVVGFYGKLNGWILGIILGGLITFSVYLLSISIGYSSGGDSGLAFSTNQILPLVIAYMIFTMFSILGAIAGRWLKRKKKP